MARPAPPGAHPPIIENYRQPDGSVTIPDVLRPFTRGAERIGPPTDVAVDDGLRSRRVQYETAGLDVADVDPNPIVQWRRWYDEASSAGVTEPNAMVVATVGDDGRPDARFVLVRGADEDGFVVHTNYESGKSRHLAAHPHGGD